MVEARCQPLASPTAHNNTPVLVMSVAITDQRVEQQVSDEHVEPVSALALEYILAAYMVDSL
jgi:hypothetical protein